MRRLLIILSLALTTQMMSAADISTNFWDKCSERTVSLHRYIGEVSDLCSKKEVKDLGINNNQVIAAVQLLEAHLKPDGSTSTPLSEVKRAVKVHLYLAVISEKSSGVTMRILAFSKLTDEQKQELINKTERANQLITKLTTDVAEYIHNVSELGL